MIWVLLGFILLLIIGVISIKKEESKKFNYKENIRNNNSNLKLDFDNVDSFELKGVHISSRKGYILANCNDYDEVFLNHDKENKYSSTAISVSHLDTIIGYLPDESTSHILKIINSQPYKSYIESSSYFDEFLDVYIGLEW